MTTQHVIACLPRLADLAAVCEHRRYEVRLAKIRHTVVVDDELDYGDPAEAEAADAVLLVCVNLNTCETEELARCDVDGSAVSCIQGVAWALEHMRDLVHVEQSIAAADASAQYYA